MFVSFEENCIATASISQVHVAYIRLTEDDCNAYDASGARVGGMANRTRSSNHTNNENNSKCGDAAASQQRGQPTGQAGGQEGEESVEERFARACDYARGLEKGAGGGLGGGAGGAPLSDAVRLRMYAMYKQSTEGPVGTSKTSRSKPSMLYPVKRAKWNAWAALGDMTRATAMDLYASELFRMSGEHEQKKGNKVNKLNKINRANASNAGNESKRESARGGGAGEETKGETKREHDSGSPRAPTRAERTQSDGGHNEWAPGRVVKVAVKVQMPGKRQ